MKFIRALLCNMIITTVLAMSMQTASASSFLWTTSEGFGSSSVAATFNITGGSVTTNTSDQTEIIYYTDAGCNTGSNTIVSGNYTFRNPSTVYANGSSIYNIIQSAGVTPSDIHSIQIVPSSASINLFTTTECFAVTCSASACTSSVVHNVTLQ